MYHVLSNLLITIKMTPSWFDPPSMPDLMFHFLGVNEVISLYQSPSRTLCSGKSKGLSLTTSSPCIGILLLSPPPFLSTSQIQIVLLWMRWLMKDPSCVINIFHGLGIVCRFNYHSEAHLLLRWHVPAKCRFIPSTLCISAHQLCRWQQLHIYVFW